jgi:hypothetical protein
MLKDIMPKRGEIYQWNYAHAAPLHATDYFLVLSEAHIAEQVTIYWINDCTITSVIWTEHLLKRVSKYEL